MNRLIQLCVFSVALISAVSLSAAGIMHIDADPLLIKTGNDILAQLGPVEAPCEIVGTLSRTGVKHIFEMQLDEDRLISAAIFTHSGTGAVFTAESRFGEGEYGPVLDSTYRTISNSGMVVLMVSATTAREGAKYCIRIGDFGDFKVTFDGNGGTVPDKEKTKTYVPGRKYGVLPTPTYITHEFKGWFTEKSGGVRIYTNTVVCTGYTNLFAQWSEAVPVAPTNDLPVEPSVTNYTVRFLANGGYGSMTTQTFTYGEAKALLKNAFARTNYTFQGWAKTASGGVEYRDGAVVSNLTTKADDVVELHASWLGAADSVRTETVNGVTWHYLLDGATATIANIDESTNYVAAIDKSIKGRLVIPDSLGGAMVAAIGKNAFVNCSDLTEVDIPPTVTSIGTSAFAGCLGITPGITIPESVTDMGAKVFDGCGNLRIVRYLGDCPQVDADLYTGAPDKLISGALRVRTGWGTEEEVKVETPEKEEASQGTAETADTADLNVADGADDEAASATVIRLPERWPEGSSGRKVYWLNGVKILGVPLYANGGALDEDDSKMMYYLPDRPLGILPEPTFTLLSDDDDTDVVFLGWYTAKNGGMKVEEDTKVFPGMKLYAHWMVGGGEVSDWQESMYADADDFIGDSAQVYDGYLYNDVSSNDCEVVGTLTIKVSAGRFSRQEDAKLASATATVQLLGQKRLTFKGKIDESGSGELESGYSEEPLSVLLTANGLAGSFGDYTISGARNRTSSSEQVDRLLVSTSLARWQGTWNVVLQASDVQGADADAVSDCYCTFTATVGSKGKTKVQGMLPDGTKVSVTSSMVFGDNCGYVPVCVPLYPGRRGGFAFLLWFCTDEEEPMRPWGMGEWRAVGGKLQFTASLAPVAWGAAAELPWSSATFALGERAFEIEGFELEDSLLPDDVPITNRASKWVLPRADRVKFIRDDGAYEVATENDNPSGLKLSYSRESGSFKGSFKLFGINEGGSSKKMTAKVTGVVVDGIGYGSAFVKPFGSMPVTVTAE